MEPWKSHAFIKFSMCSGGNKAGDGSGTTRKSEEEEGSKLGDHVFVKFSLCSGGNKAVDGIGSTRKSEEEGPSMEALLWSIEFKLGGWGPR